MRSLRERHARRLRDERHGAARARIRLDHVDGIALNGVLHVHEAAHAERERDARRRVAQLLHERLGEGERRDARCRIARVNARLLDVLQDAADVDFVAVTERIDVALDGAFQETIEVDRVIG